jgi:hypothetical protein
MAKGFGAGANQIVKADSPKSQAPAKKDAANGGSKK